MPEIKLKVRKKRVPRVLCPFCRKKIPFLLVWVHPCKPMDAINE